ncbi:GMC oxidoreductase [Aplosporella prunicola CBS 121167]|uniref:GMC oxidoreductase n=1 Tax=Aplosporella prunicola CBS 121167 TaxID=1176127 RepID=A0A6A6B0X1_9PEZI|nr:GMC oxidoreductase [Aplosporella prunicola CBS 121167]KAF2137208.1 GMC oxidoreductase [Aplosporella prunicola CBS 121167]
MKLVSTLSILAHLSLAYFVPLSRSSGSDSDPASWGSDSDSFESEDTYDYIVVGSGPGGGPLSANLARAGHSVLLLEAGSDEGTNPNVTLVANINKAINDPSTHWNFWVSHYDDPEEEAKYLHQVWQAPDGSYYVGQHPPVNSTGYERLGIWYPRAGTLGGCAMHNAASSILPNDEDWNFIADSTGDESWTAENMRKYLVRLERNLYLPRGTPGHGFDGWLNTTMRRGSSGNQTGVSDGTIIAESLVRVTGGDPSQALQYIQRDPNALDPQRDFKTGIFGGVLHADQQGHRDNPNNYIHATLADASNYPLTLQLNSLVTKILFDDENKRPENSVPTAIGVEYLQGQSLYKADPRYNANQRGVKRQAYARREVIISGGVFNSPQILKLSGIGPAKELANFQIPLVKDLPGVGTNVGDNYEGGLVALAAREIEGDVASAQVFLKSSQSERVRDIHGFCGEFILEGFWPGLPNDYGPNQYECSFVKMRPRSQAGTVTLRSADPRDIPDIHLRFFEKGEDEDLQAMLEGIKLARAALDDIRTNLAPFTELHPCTRVGCTDEDQKEYIKSQVYSHHATGTCAIGDPNNPWAVVDSRFRVIGIDNLRVVDGSVFPVQPGSFPVLPTFMLSEKALEVILADAE